MSAEQWNPFETETDIVALIKKMEKLQDYNPTERKEPDKAEWLLILLTHYGAPALLKERDVNVIAENIKALIEQLST